MVIVYHTDTGFTREYAMLLSRAEGVRMCSLEEAGYQLQPGERVLFLGPLMAGTIKGLKKARQLCEVVGVCGVGMSPPGPQALGALKQKNGTGELPLLLTGGLGPRPGGPGEAVHGGPGDPFHPPRSGGEGG